jgi:hypothetical protein
MGSGMPLAVSEAAPISKAPCSGWLNERPSFDLGDKVYYRYGHSCDEVSEELSNYRELLNLVESLELQVREGRMLQAEAFLFTDSSTAEAVFYNGNSTSKKLFELVLHLRRLEMEAKMVIRYMLFMSWDSNDLGRRGRWVPRRP